MSEVIIKATNIGKKYRITHQRGSYVAFRDVLMNIIRKPFAFLKTKMKRSVGPAGKKEDFWALKNINFEIKRGEVVGIIGRNGAGKSTLLKILSQITPPTTGEIVIHGRVGSLLEVGTGFHPELTGRENIFLNGAILGMGRKEIAAKFDEIVSFSGVEKFLDTPVKHYSSGMTVRLAFSVAAHLDPDILIVDEVLAVGDAEFQKKCLGKMEEVTQQEGRTIIFVSHNMAAIEQLCTSCILLEDGQITAIGPTAEIASLYEKKFAGAANIKAVVERKTSPKPFYLSRVALTDLDGAPKTDFNYGDSMRIVLSAEGEATADNFTIEFNLYDEDGTKISFGAANPVRQTFYKKEDKQFICELGPLPLMTGIYSFDFSARLWGSERWDNWEQAIAFEIRKCDPWDTGHSIPGRTNGSFVIDQKWS